MMHGFIDLIFEKDGQYFVADYKSTHLGSQLTDYHFDAMQHSVYSSSYDLQYAIYMVALHRYLQSRMTNYSPETHLGGVYYLYLRGMHPEHTTGVFYDSFPVDALYELDAIFSRNSAEVDR
jgi:exodeoxyribonuclease V beta subunit